MCGYYDERPFVVADVSGQVEAVFSNIFEGGEVCRAEFIEDVGIFFCDVSGLAGVSEHIVELPFVFGLIDSAEFLGSYRASDEFIFSSRV